MNNSAARCPICEGALKSLNENHPGYQEPFCFKIMECAFCDTQLAVPTAVDSRIYDLIYHNVSKLPGYDRYYRFAQQIKDFASPIDFLKEQEEMYWFIYDYLRKNAIDKKSHVLEIGSGLGYLTYSLRKAGYNITGLDISERAVATACKNFGEFYICRDLFEFAESHPDSVDIVIMLETIEHVPNPKDFISAIHKLLKPGGFALITTPNKSIHSPNTYWETENPPIHLWWFSERSMIYIAQATNFHVTFYDFSEYHAKTLTSDLASHIRRPPERRIKPPFFDANGNLATGAESYGRPQSPSFARRVARGILPGRLFAFIKRIYNDAVDRPRCSRDFLIATAKANAWRSGIIGAVFNKQI